MILTTLTAIHCKNIISDVINNEIMIMRCHPPASVMGVFMELKQVSINTGLMYYIRIIRNTRITQLRSNIYINIRVSLFVGEIFIIDFVLFAR